MGKLMALCVTAIIFLWAGGHATALEINGFGDITYSDSSKEVEDGGDNHGSFTLGQLDLWGTQRIDQDGKMKAFMELVVENDGEGFVVDLERLWVEYAVLPSVKIRGGRFHISMGHWNRTHHHGAHMQTSVSRPAFLDFEDGESAIFPSHMIGLMALADAGYEFGNFHLEIQFANGSSIKSVGTTKEPAAEIEPNNVIDVDNSKSIAARLIFSPTVIEGLNLGFSFVTNKVLDDSTGALLPLVRQNIFETDITYQENNVEFIFEHYWINDRNDVQGSVDNGANYTSTAYFVQLGYTLFEALTPYVRWEYLDNINKDDVYFKALQPENTTVADPDYKEYYQLIYGARYDLNYNSSVKIEGRSVSEDPSDFNKETSSVFLAQWTFAF
ncbi:MAG: hypothetical protein ACE5FU_09060 [Nitrospinota bacterium]